MLLKTGRVTLDGVVLQDSAQKISEESPLCVDGTILSLERFVYLMMNKPAGVISSTEDPREKTVLDLLPERYQNMGVFPVGRLDKDTEGLLLLSNDGPLAHHLLSPRYHVEKHYFVRVEGELDAEDVTAFSGGMVLRDGTHCLPARLEPLPAPSCALVMLHEGKYHQVKRMLAARGKPVQYLKRFAMGPLCLDESLLPGEVRPLREEERLALRSELP